MGHGRRNDRAQRFACIPLIGRRAAIAARRFSQIPFPSIAEIYLWVMKLKIFKRDVSMPRRVAGVGILKYRLLAFLAVFGPGFITANVDNDPGGILTYSQAGAKFGYALLWTLIPTTIALIVVQEMAARMGAVTGKGLSDLIREEFGLRATFITMAILSVADFGNIAAEFAGIASGMGVFGVSKYFAVPVGAALVWIVIVKGRYKPVERMLILFSLIYFTYP